MDQAPESFRRRNFFIHQTNPTPAQSYLRQIKKSRYRVSEQMRLRWLDENEVAGYDRMRDYANFPSTG